MSSIKNNPFGKFDAEQVEPMRTGGALPMGVYNVVMMDANWQQTKAKTGNMLVVKFEVLDGDCKGRHVSTRLNLDNPSEAAVRIAQSELSSICRAVGVLKPGSEYDLLNKPLQVSVGIETSPDGKEYNRIQGYAAPGGEIAQPYEVKGKGRSAAGSPNHGDDDDLPFR